MKKILILFFILFTLVQTGKSQTAEKRLAVGFSISKNLYVGDYGGNGILDIGHTEMSQGYLSFGLSFAGYISRSIDFGIQANYGDYGYFNTVDFTKQKLPGVDAPNSFLAIKYQATTSIKYKIHFINEDDKFVPFLTLGMGIAGYARNTAKDKPINPDNGEVTSPRLNDRGTDLIVPFGGGFKYRLSEKIAIQYQYLYNLTNSDIHDTHMGSSPGVPNYDLEHRKPGNDAFGEHVFSVILSISTPTFDKNNIWKKQGYKPYQSDNWKTYRYRKK